MASNKDDAEDMQLNNLVIHTLYGTAYNLKS